MNIFKVKTSGWWNILTILFFLFIVSCKKAGLGGDNIIIAYPQHHGKTISNYTNYRDTVYVKFNATDLPGTNPSDFDKMYIGQEGEPNVYLKGLQIGKYYLYCVGWDTTINQRVVGGLGIELKNLTAETVLYLPVTE